MSYDTEKVNEYSLALLYLVTHNREQGYGARVWKSFDWETMNRLNAKGLIASPVGKSKSVIITEEGPESKRLAPDTHQINAAVASSYGIETTKLLTAKRGAENEPRNVAIYMARHLKGESLTKIGEAFNLNRDSSVSSAIERFRKRIETDKAFRKRVNRIKERLFKQTKASPFN